MRNRPAMERDLYAKLLEHGTDIRAAVLKTHIADVETDGPYAEVRLDVFLGGVLECVVHELLHATYEKQLKPWGRMEETIVLALEAEIARYITNRLELQDKWRRAVSRKLLREDD